MCCCTEIEVADQTFCLFQSQYTDTGPTSTNDLKIGTSLATLQGAWRERVGAGTGWPVSVYCD